MVCEERGEAHSFTDPLVFLLELRYWDLKHLTPGKGPGEGLTHRALRGLTFRVNEGS